MEVKPTFFSVSGFLVPGIVLVGTVLSLIAVHYSATVPDFFVRFSSLTEGAAAAAFIGTLAIAALLAISFVLGAVLSDTFTLVARQFFIRPLLRPRLRRNVGRLFAHRSLEDLVTANMDARESFVYMRASGLDLNWYAGRVRMMGSTGFALLISMCVALKLCFSSSVVLGLGLLAVWTIVVAMYRSNKFDEYVAASAAVIIRQRRSTARDDQDMEP